MNWVGLAAWVAAMALGWKLGEIAYRKAGLVEIELHANEGRE